MSGSSLVTSQIETTHLITQYHFVSDLRTRNAFAPAYGMSWYTWPQRARRLMALSLVIITMGVYIVVIPLGVQMKKYNRPTTFRYAVLFRTQATYNKTIQFTNANSYINCIFQKVFYYISTLEYPIIRV